MTAPLLGVAYAIDLTVGDPEWFPHPVRLFGLMIRNGERLLRRGDRLGDLVGGAVLTAAVASIAWASGHPRSKLWQALLAWTALATRSLLDESGAVIEALETGDMATARRRLARIVGRDTANLDEAEIARAVIETLAESACDGIVAPLFWLAVGGVPMAMAYKSVNTLDSMIGHPEPPYRDFGRVAARLDDAMNLVPSRLTAIGIAAAARIRHADWRQALVVWLRDGSKHASPNAGQSEAAMAGALGVRLGGVNTYDGVERARPHLLATGRAATVADARAARSMVAVVSGFALVAAAAALLWKQRR